MQRRTKQKDLTGKFAEKNKTKKGLDRKICRKEQKKKNLTGKFAEKNKTKDLTGKFAVKNKTKRNSKGLTR